MAKKTRLHLEDLEVQSFVTSLRAESKALVKGGGPDTDYCTEDPCPVSKPWVCPTEPQYPTCDGGYTCGPCC